MLHWALREVLGDHVKQAGSLVTPDMLRFDFSHFEAVDEQQLDKIESLINERIFSNNGVSKQEMAKDEAISAGAIAFFGEKYGDKVRVVKVGGFSTELCGGTHVDDTGEIGLFKIVSESSIASGVRRIVAYTSQTAFDYLKTRDQEVKVLRGRLKAASLEDMESKLDKLLQSEKDLKKQLEKFRSQQLAQQIDGLIEEAAVIKGHKLVSFLCPEDDQGMKTLRELSDQLLQKAPQAIVALGMIQASQQKASLLVARGKQGPSSVSAQQLIQAVAPLFNGKGGGKPEMAQAGGDKLDGLKQAMHKVPELLATML
jgi:alanyl-tRNA synthetase